RAAPSLAAAAELFLLLFYLRMISAHDSRLAHPPRVDPSHVVIYLHTGTCSRWIVSAFWSAQQFSSCWRCWSISSSGPGRTSTGRGFSNIVLTGITSFTASFSFTLRIFSVRFAGKFSSDPFASALPSLV